MVVGGKECPCAVILGQSGNHSGVRVDYDGLIGLSSHQSCLLLCKVTQCDTTRLKGLILRV
jgi:hypothetical protein